MKPREKAIKYLSAGILVTLVILISAFVWYKVTSPEAALQKFYANDDAEPRAEDMLMDPLIIAGRRVVPLVLDKVKDKNMPRRRYAIGFLGNGSYKEALPALQHILQDKSEKDYFRGDALRSIYMIDESLGLSYTQKYKNRADCLGEDSRDILNGKAYLERRSYFDALIGKHY